MGAQQITVGQRKSDSYLPGYVALLGLKAEKTRGVPDKAKGRLKAGINFPAHKKSKKKRGQVSA